MKTSYQIKELKKKKPKDYKKSYTHRPSTKSAAVSDRTLFTEAHLLKYTKQKVQYQGSAEHAWHNSETRILNCYMSRIDKKIEDICPNCNNPGHTTQHLFDCAENPTDLAIDALWKQPVEASTFLRLEDDTEI